MESQNKTVTDARRRKRIQAYKKGIIITALTLIILPILLCIILFVKVGKLQNQISDIKNYIEEKDEEETPETTTEESTVPDEKEDAQKETTTEVSKPTTVKPYQTWTKEQQQIIDSYKGMGEGKKIYLTFDDGPSVNTDDILDILDYYGIKATFFVVGKEDATSLKAYKSIAEKGHTIGLHSYSHRYVDIYSSLDNFVADLNKIQTLVYECTGQKSFLYRFPGGSSTTKAILPINTFIVYLNENGYRYFDWNATCGDGASATVPMEKIVTNIMDDAVKHNNCVALLHDAKSKATTLEGLPLLIETLLNAGFEICPIDDDTALVQHRVAVS